MISDAWVDVDTSDGTGDAGQLTGCAPRTDEFGSFCGTFRDNFEVIDRDNWVQYAPNESLARSLVEKIKNQRQEGTCTSNATTQAMEIIWNQQFGQDKWVELSPISIYKHCGRSPSSGSSVTCNIRQARETGAIPCDTAENKAWMESVGLNTRHVMETTGFHQRFPQDWEQTANSFRIDETFDIGDFDEFATALLMGFPVVYGRKGHAICGVRLVKHKGQWSIEYANSWGNWGNAGYGYDTERYVASDIRRYGAIAVRSLIVPEYMVA